MSVGLAATRMALASNAARSSIGAAVVTSATRGKTQTDDTRCPEQVVVAPALSWLGKTTAIYDGGSVEIIEHDPAAVRAEAEADDGFRRLLAEADAARRDGLLDGAEARLVEQRVLELLEARYAAKDER